MRSLSGNVGAICAAAALAYTSSVPGVSVAQTLVEQVYGARFPTEI
jgi:hypothetical protein